MILLSIVSVFLSSYETAFSLKRLTLQILSLIGILAFPLFILHEMVIPLKGILVNIGITDTAALIIPMLSFLAISILMLKKLYKVSFG
jgi:hypothetical protein